MRFKSFLQLIHLFEEVNGKSIHSHCLVQNRLLDSIGYFKSLKHLKKLARKFIHVYNGLHTEF